MKSFKVEDNNIFVFVKSDKYGDSIYRYRQGLVCIHKDCEELYKKEFLIYMHNPIPIGVFAFKKSLKWEIFYTFPSLKMKYKYSKNNIQIIDRGNNYHFFKRTNKLGFGESFKKL